MLYVSTKNQTDTFTAYRALNESTAPDGGVFVPFHLPVFTQEELTALKTQPCCDTLAQVLNLFFGTHVTGLDVEFELSKTPFKLETMQHKFVVVECWKNPGYSYDYILNCLYALMTDNKTPAGWACVGIKIALLFGLYSQIGEDMRGLDVAITAGDYSDLAAIAYAKAMGLPVDTMICACDDDGVLWDLVNRGTYSAGRMQPNYLDVYLYIVLGMSATQLQEYGIDEEKMAILTNNTFAAVVSKNRIDSVVSNMYRTNGYSFDTESALAYGGLQDYRSSTGISKDTLLFSKNRPIRIKE